MDRRSIFIGGLLLVQALLPAHYYLSGHDPYDERFAWRMFSPIRMLKCGSEFKVGPTQTTVNLEQQFHVAWITLTRRGRHEVTEAMGRRICLLNPGEEVRLHYVCKEMDGTRVDLSLPDHDICPDGRW